MADDFDAYDPEEIKRRQMLSPEGANYGEASTPVGAMGAEDEEDYPPSSIPPTSSVHAPRLTEAQMAYQKALSAAPKAEDYAPSRGRRALAAIAGGLTGLRDPRLGVQIAQDTISAPYQQAQGAWKSSLQPLASQVDMESAASAQQLAQERADAYQTRQQALMTGDQARQQYYNNQANKPTAWQPQSEEEYVRAHQAIQRPATPVRPSAFDQYKDDPDTYNQYLQDQAAAKAKEPKSDVLSPEAFKQKMMLKETGRPREPKTPTTPKQPSPADQIKAEQIATQELLRQNPKYKSFVQGGEIVKGKQNPTRVLTADELPKSGMFNSVTPAQESLAREMHRQFLSDLDKKKREVLGRLSGQPTWSITPNEED